MVDEGCELLFLSLLCNECTSTTFQSFFFHFRSMQVDISGLSEAGDVKFIGDSSFRIIDGSVVVSKSDSISSSSSDESEDEMSFTANG